MALIPCSKVLKPRYNYSTLPQSGPLYLLMTSLYCECIIIHKTYGDSGIQETQSIITKRKNMIIRKRNISHAMNYFISDFEDPHEILPIFSSLNSLKGSYQSNFCTALRKLMSSLRNRRSDLKIQENRLSISSRLFKLNDAASSYNSLILGELL